MESTTRQPRPTPDLKGTDLGDEYLFYDRDGDRVHVLNGAAREIFLLCDGSRTGEQVAQEFSSRHDVDAEVARSDAHDTIRQLAELGLLQL